MHGVIKINYNLREGAVHENAVCEDAVHENAVPAVHGCEDAISEDNGKDAVCEDAIGEGVFFPLLDLMDE